LSFAFLAFRKRRTSQGSSLGHIYVSSFGFLCVNYISVFALTRACKWGLLISLYELGTCESRFTITALLLSALNTSHSDCPNATLKNPALIVRAVPCHVHQRQGGCCPFARDACGACDEDLRAHGSGCDFTTSPGVQATCNPLEPPSESSPGRPEG
jgi:hypothetical protein